MHRNASGHYDTTALGAVDTARELTGQRRNRVFSYDAYLAILNEGGEPL